MTYHEARDLFNHTMALKPETKEERYHQICDLNRAVRVLLDHE
jgi:hypothetical protein